MLHIELHMCMFMCVCGNYETAIMHCMHYANVPVCFVCVQLSQNRSAENTTTA